MDSEHGASPQDVEGGTATWTLVKTGNVGRGGQGERGVLCRSGHHVQEEKGSWVRRVAVQPVPFECCLLLSFVYNVDHFYGLYGICYNIASIVYLLVFWPCRVLFPWPGIKPTLLLWEAKSLTPGPPGGVPEHGPWWPIQAGTENSCEGQWGQGGEVCRACWAWWALGTRI